VELAIIAFFAAAALYASVGHGGASGYLAVMALLSFAPESARITALVLNIPVALLALWNYRAHLSWQKLWPLAVAGVPLAYVGGLHRLAPQSYALLLGVTLIISALWLVLKPRNSDATRVLHPVAALALGASLGLLAGLTGIGGGVFLSPVLLLGGFAATKPTAAISAAFIALNSAAGLAAQVKNLSALPDSILSYAFAAIAGGFLGSHFAARYGSSVWLLRVLAVVLLIAAGKLLGQI
jgi:uncharacterized protein